MTKIPDLDQWLRDLTDGLPREPRQYEFRCHPDVYIAIREAADAEPWTPPDGYAAPASPVFGGAAVRVHAEMGPGCWELHEDGRLLKAGRIGDILPAYVYLYSGMHRHGISGPAWQQHDHMGGGIPHAHDPDTGFQVELREAGLVP